MKILAAYPGITAPNDGALRTRTFSHILATVSGRSLLDLGAGPCIFAMKARDAGYRVTAVDARRDRVPSPEQLGGIKFIQADIRTFDVAGYDVIAILGLLYHLTLDDQRELLDRCNYGAAVIVDTQIHDPHIIPPAADPWAREPVHDRNYEGVLFPERANSMASVINSHSFWHTETSLMRLFEDCGFHTVTTFNPHYVTKYGARKFYAARGGR